MDNNLGSIIKNDRARRIIYGTWFIAGIAIGATQAWYTDPDPEWVLKAFDVWSYLGLPIAALASANAHSKPDVAVFTGVSTSEFIEEGAAPAEGIVIEAPEEDRPLIP